jgi:hypothetical protein
MNGVGTEDGGVISLRLVLELVLGPMVIAAATLVARRFGPRAGGWLIGLPLTSGPVAVVVAAQDGAGFVPGLASGFLAGLAGQAAFALVYATLATRGWPRALAGAACAYAAIAGLLVAAHAAPMALVPCAVGALALALRLAPAGAAAGPARRGWTDLVVRMGLCSMLILGIATIAPLVGPTVGGAVSSFPLLATLLAVLSHRQAGPADAIAVCRGLLSGAFSVAGFAVALLALAQHVALAPTFALAFAATLAIHAASARVSAPA